MYFMEGELDESLVCAKFAHPKKYGRRVGLSQIQNIAYYNFDVMVKVVVDLINQDNQ